MNKKTVSVTVGSFTDGPLESIKKQIADAENEAYLNNITNLALVSSAHTDRCGDFEVSISIVGDRIETDEECIIREKQEEDYRIHEIDRQKEFQEKREHDALELLSQMGYTWKKP